MQVVNLVRYVRYSKVFSKLLYETQGHLVPKGVYILSKELGLGSILVDSDGRRTAQRCTAPHCTRTLFSSYYCETSSRDRLRDRCATTVRSFSIRRHGDDDIGADAERIVKVKVTARLGVLCGAGDIAAAAVAGRINVHAHALHVRCCAVRDYLLHGAGVEAFHGHGCARVQVSVVYSILGYHWRDYEEFARAGDFFLVAVYPRRGTVKKC